MNYPSGIVEYFTGKYFKPLLQLEYDRNETKNQSRWDYLVNQATEKKVLHIGCLDHEPMIKVKRENGDWLHDKVSSVSSACIGIDIDSKLIELVKQKYQVNNIIDFNFMNNDVLPNELEGHWDTILLPDVIEHIPNPVEFLEKLRLSIGKSASSLVITTPNALCYDNIRLSLQNKEHINSDHISIFTPYTLGKTVTAAGWDIKEIDFINYHPAAKTTGVRSFLRSKALKSRPLLRDTIALICTTS